MLSNTRQYPKNNLLTAWKLTGSGHSREPEPASTSLNFSLATSLDDSKPQHLFLVMATKLDHDLGRRPPPRERPGNRTDMFFLMFFIFACDFGGLVWIDGFCFSVYIKPADRWNILKACQSSADERVHWTSKLLPWICDGQKSNSYNPYASWESIRIHEENQPSFCGQCYVNVKTVCNYCIYYVHIYIYIYMMIIYIYYML